MLTMQEFKSLADARGDELVSIYLPTHRRGRDITQDPIRLKNLVKQAEELADEQGLRAANIRDALKPAQALVDDREFWRHQGDALAIFAAPGGGFGFHRLATPTEELVDLGGRYNLRPLLPSVTDNRQFYVLALSQGSVRLLTCSRTGARLVDDIDIPENIADALGWDWEERTLQFHTSSARSIGAQRAAVFHGQGGGTDESKEEVEQFLHQVEKGITRFLNERKGPLVLACVDYVHAMYRKINHHPDLIDDFVEGNPDHLDVDEIHKRALEVVRPHLDKRQSERVHALKEAHGHGRARIGVPFVLEDLRHARVETLFARCDEATWGRVENGAGEVEIHEKRQAKDEDLVDRAISDALATGADTIPIDESDAPGGEPVAALLRY